MFTRLLKRWEISASTGSHFDVLDGLRGVAILLVVCSHALYTNPSQGIIQKLVNYGLIQGGWMGVPIFFVLSGFLISYPFFQKRETDPQFWNQRGYAWRRLGKILPPFFLSIIVFVAFYWWQDGDAGYVRSGLIWATGLGNFVLTQPMFNEYYWSLIVETHFYLLLPLLIWLFRGLKVSQLTVALFLVFFLVPLITRSLTWPAGVTTFPGSDRDMQLHLSRFPNQLDYFGWGILFAGGFTGLKPVLAQLRSLSVLGYAGALLLVVAMVFWGLWMDQFDIRAHPARWSEEMRHCLPALAAFLMLFFVFDPQSWGAKFLSSGWLRFTGLISFEWFLFHPPVCHWFLEHGGHTHGSLLAYAWKTVVPVVITFIFSALVYRYFSLPILHRIRDRLKQARTP
jgi:peptidoglycan/LPS O-acetylase OafA/YrhL